MMYTEKPYEWYYPRTEFAEQMYFSLTEGSAKGAVFFGPRHTGKTCFLLHDFAPLAERNGHLVVYTNLWPTGQPVLTTLLEDFDRTLRANSLWGRLKSVATRMSPGYKTVTLGEGLKLDASARRPEAVNPMEGLLLIDRYCERFASYKKPTFLIFDEFQEFAKTDYTELLDEMLQTSLGPRKEKIIPVFTGSSPDALRRIFSERGTPFYHFALSYDMPPLDSKFVDYLIEKTARSLAASIDRATAIEVFDRFDQNPLLFRKWLAAAINMPNASTQEIIDAASPRIFSKLKFQEQWIGISPKHRDIVKRVASGDTRLTGNVYRSGPGEHIYDFTPVQPSIKSEADQLTSLGILNYQNGNWQIGDPFLKAWVLGLPESE